MLCHAAGACSTVMRSCTGWHGRLRQQQHSKDAQKGRRRCGRHCTGARGRRDVLLYSGDGCRGQDLGHLRHHRLLDWGGGRRRGGGGGRDHGRGLWRGRWGRLLRGGGRRRRRLAGRRRQLRTGGVGWGGGRGEGVIGHMGRHKLRLPSPPTHIGKLHAPVSQAPPAEGMHPQQHVCSTKLTVSQ